MPNKKPAAIIYFMIRLYKKDWNLEFYLDPQELSKWIQREHYHILTWLKEWADAKIFPIWMDKLDCTSPDEKSMSLCLRHDILVIALNAAIGSVYYSIFLEMIQKSGM